MDDETKKPVDGVEEVVPVEVPDMEETPEVGETPDTAPEAVEQEEAA